MNKPLSHVLIQVLNDFEGQSFTSRELATKLHIEPTIVEKELDFLANSHYPVKKTRHGYAIPKESKLKQVALIALFAALLHLGLLMEGLL